MMYIGGRFEAKVRRIDCLKIYVFPGEDENLKNLGNIEMTLRHLI